MSRNARMAIALAAVLVCLAIAIATPEPNRYSRSGQTIHDYLHVPGFGFVAAMLLWGFPVAHGASLTRRLRQVIVVSGLTIASGVGVELAQRALGGRADPWDVVHDVAGVTVTALFAVSLWRRTSMTARWSLRLVAAVTALAFFWPSVAALADEQRARDRFPILVDFSSSEEASRFEWSGCRYELTGLKRGDDPASEGALEIAFEPGDFPGFTLRYFPRDWSRYRALVISLTNPSSEPFPISVRIDDMAHDESYGDRYNGKFVVAPGVNGIRIPLADVAAAPHGRTLDLTRVRTVIVFTDHLAEPRHLVLRYIQLEN